MKTSISHSLFPRSFSSLIAPLALGLSLAFSPVASAEDDDRREHQELREAHKALDKELHAARERRDRAAIIELEHELRLLESEHIRREARQHLIREEESREKQEHRKRERDDDRGERIEQRIDELSEHMKKLHHALEELEEEIEELRELAEEHDDDDDDEDEDEDEDDDDE